MMNTNSMPKIRSTKYFIQKSMNMCKSHVCDSVILPASISTSSLMVP